jgi:hypothetical protein
VLTAQEAIKQATIAAPDGQVVREVWEDDARIVIIYGLPNDEVSFESGPMIVNRSTGKITYVATSVDPETVIEGMIPVSLT